MGELFDKLPARLMPTIFTRSFVGNDIHLFLYCSYWMLVAPLWLWPINERKTV